ncbi:MAG: hypothetical protein ABIJ47_06140 [Candidatus Bathyarchaeota archaeon]
MFTCKFLRGWWSRALRRRILFTALDKSDRGYLYLAMRAFDEIRNADVGTIIVKILAKLKDALESPFVRRMETYGIEKARSISRKAVEWGHDTAEEWANEAGFIRYLTVLDFNKPSGWGV